jgi:N6-adenosine-specific RNA methylase IME4
MPKRAGLQLRGSKSLEKIVLGNFTLTATGVLVKGRPSSDEFQHVFDFATRVEKASPWWVVGLLKYASGRRDWQDTLDQITHVTGYGEGRIRNLRTLGEKIPEHRRREDVDISVHEAVLSLPPAEQDELLEQAAEENWTVRETRMAVRARRRRAVIDGQAVLEGQFRVIYADFPWIYNDSQPSGSSAQTHYPGMTIEEGCALPVKEHAYKDAVLFFWVTEPMLYRGAQQIIEAWGFEHKTGLVWDKVDHNRGNYVSVRHEHLLICTRGSCTPENLTPMIDSVQTIRKGEHSAKPEEFRQIIERLYPTGPHLELFGRKRVKGWKVVGNDARLWAKELGS